MSTICTHFAPFSFSYLQQQRPLVISTCGFFLNFLVNFSNRALSSLMIASFMAWIRASSSREDSSELSVTFFFFFPLVLPPLSGAPSLVVSLGASGSDSESSIAGGGRSNSLALASSSSLRLRFFSLFFRFYSFFLLFFFSFSRSCTSLAARATFALRLARLPMLDSSN